MLLGGMGEAGEGGGAGGSKGGKGSRGRSGDVILLAPRDLYRPGEGCRGRRGLLGWQAAADERGNLVRLKMTTVVGLE